MKRQIEAQIICTVFCALLTILPSKSNAQTKDASYFCTAEVSGGFQYNKVQKKWEGVAFPADHKFILRLKFLRTYLRKKEDQFDEDETFNVYDVMITDAGTSLAIPCTGIGKKEVSVGKYNTVFCERSFLEYKINLNRLRYLVTYAVGYAVGQERDEESDTPYLEGGTCTKIE
jgi:hypothetical protein